MSSEHPQNVDEWREKKIDEIKKDAEKRRKILSERVKQGYDAGLSIIADYENQALSQVEKRYNDLKKTI